MTGDTARPVKVSPESILRECKAIAESITPENLAEKKAALLALLDPAAEDGQSAPVAAN
jgi:hypothetical protein